jgi:hypothetical protein
MKKIFTRNRLYLLFPVYLLVFALLSPAVHAEAMWVHGSWVNVRETADAKSTVIGHVTTNTSVNRLERQGKMCEIAWGEEMARQGFVACGLLGKKPLTLVEVTTESLGYDPQKQESIRNPKYSPPRAFWIAPSARTLLAAGEYFEQTLLSAKQYQLESELDKFGEKFVKWPPPIVRYPVPEFEAMKALLAGGIVVGKDLDPPLLSQRQIGQLGVKGQNDEYERVERLLPEIHPSFFKENDHILPGSADIERVSAHFGIVERGQVLKGPRWVFDHYTPRHLEGAWDIGRYELTLDKPVFEHVIGDDGLVGIYEWRQPALSTYVEGYYNKEVFAYDLNLCGHWDEVGVTERFVNERQGKIPLPGYPDVKDALLWFQSPVALPLQKARVSRRTAQDTDRNSGNIISIHEIDLDHDGVADFVRWEEMKNEYTGWRVVFVNINGEWYPFERDDYEVCTGG